MTDMIQLSTHVIRNHRMYWLQGSIDEKGDYSFFVNVCCVEKDDSTKDILCCEWIKECHENCISCPYEDDKVVKTLTNEFRDPIFHALQAAEIHLGIRTRKMQGIITFDESSKHEILEIFGKTVDSRGYLVDIKTGEPVVDRDGCHILFTEFGGIYKGEFLKNDIFTTLDLIDRFKNDRNILPNDEEP
jgi:hypothetical protein